MVTEVSNPVVYAGGDSAANGGLPLTPVASYDGKVIAAISALARFGRRIP